MYLKGLKGLALKSSRNDSPLKYLNIISPLELGWYSELGSVPQIL